MAHVATGDVWAFDDVRADGESVERIVRIDDVLITYVNATSIQTGQPLSFLIDKVSSGKKIADGFDMLETVKTALPGYPNTDVDVAVQVLRLLKPERQFRSYKDLVISRAIPSLKIFPEGKAVVFYNASGQPFTLSGGDLSEVDIAKLISHLRALSH